MYTIVKRFDFSASHCLDHLPPGHPCARLHGHNYSVELELASEQLDGNHMVLDYNELRQFKTYLDTVFDHRHLNDIVTFPTAEVLAKHFFDIAYTMFGKVVIAARVKETEKTCAEYRG